MGITVTEVKGFGQQKGHTELYRGAEYKVDFLPTIKIEVLVDSDIVNKVIDTFIGSAKSDTGAIGAIGDGNIFVTAVEEIVRIRTGKTGSAVI